MTATIKELCIAKAFLFDKDAKSPKAKIAAYYFGIVDVG